MGLSELIHGGAEGTTRLEKEMNNEKICLKEQWKQAWVDYGE